jgi:NADPH:quinone reductase-like Zn-dependent oxidoreductase
MRAVVMTEHGPPEVLQVQERPDPHPRDGQILIDVKAAGINFADTMARVGLYPDAPKTPSVLGYEIAGEPHGRARRGGTLFNGHAERVAANADDVLPLPDALSFEQGAAIPVNYATAWQGLLGYGPLGAGDRVLIHAAAGGVGIAATQIAKARGAELWGTASPGKHEAIRGIGVEGLPYHQYALAVGIAPGALERDVSGQGHVTFDLFPDVVK